MKFIKRGFTLIEIVIAMALISVIAIVMLRTYTYLIADNDNLASQLDFQNYSRYVYDVFNIVDSSAQTLNSPFYLKFSNDNTIGISNDPNDKKNWLLFTPDNTNKYLHELSLIWTGSVGGTQYNFFSIDISDRNNKQIYYVVR